MQGGATHKYRAMVDINLRRVMFINFRESEATHWNRFATEERKLARDFRKGDAVCFVSLQRDQHYFVYGTRDIDNGHGEQCQVLVSHKGRIQGGRGSWNGKMLANYAEQLGLRLLGRKKYEDALAEIEAEKTKGSHPRREP